MEKRRLFNIFVIVFVDLLGFGLILPLLPFYADQYGATPVIVGLLTAIYAATQFVGAPILGRLSDRYGRRPILLISIFGTFAGFLLFGVAEPFGKYLANWLSISINGTILGILFFSRALDGFTGGNISVAQAYITDVTDEENRARGLGLIGAAFGLGFIIGPALGGFLSVFGFSVPAFAAAGLSAINLIMVAFWLPESINPEERKALTRKESSRMSISTLIEALNRPRVGPILTIRLFYGLAFALFTTMFSLFAQYQLGLNARQTGYVLAYIGILIALIQGVGVGRLSRRFPDKWLIFISTIILGFSLFAWAFTPSLPTLLLILAPLAIVSGILNTLLRSELTKAVYREEVGGTLGLSASLESLTRVIAPSLGGYLLGALGTWAPGVTGALIMIGVILFAWQKIIRNPDPPLASQETKRL